MDKVFRPLDPDDNPYRQEPASVKKLLKGDGTWDTRKIILGWILDTVNGTIELPPHRVARLNAILASVTPKMKVIAVQQWHKILVLAPVHVYCHPGRPRFILLVAGGLSSCQD